MKKLVLLLAVLVVVLAIPVAEAQQFGTLVGTVVDDSKAPMPGVNVSLTGPHLQGSRVVQTDMQGQFRITPVPPGKGYKVTCELEGFQTAIKSELTVALNAESNAGTIVMKFGDIKETVVVEAKSIVVDTTKSTVDNNVDWGLIDTLATNRSFQGVVSMAPGTQVSANPYSPVNNPSVHGAQDDDNLYLINGFNQTDPRTLTWGNAINYDTIAEVQLQTAGFEAEFGRTSGGVINLVTKSGGNEVHGTLRFVWADRKFQGDPGTYDYCYAAIDRETCAAAPIGSADDPDAIRFRLQKSPDVTTTEKRPEATLGGFFLKDSLWYYLSYERRNREQDFNRPVPKVCADETDPTVEKCLDTPGPIDMSTYEGYYISGKLTWQISPNHSLVGYYNSDPIDISDTWQRYYASSFDTSKSAENIQKQGGYLAGLNLTSIYGTSTFSDIKASFYHAPLDVIPQYPMDGRNYFDLNLYYNYGDSFYDYRSIRENSNVNLSVSKFIDNMAGSHTLKAGIEYLEAKTTETTIYNPYGQYYGYGMDFAHPDNPDLLAFYVMITELHNIQHKEEYWAAYLQDKWQVKGATFNVGVRIESLDVKNNQGDTVKKFGFGDRIMPRLGFAYDMSSLGVDWLSGSAAHGSWSRFRQFVSSEIGDAFDVIPGGYNIYYYDPITNELTDTQPLSGASDLDKDITVPYVDEWTLGYDQKIGQTLSVGINYVDRVFKNGLHFKYQDQNPDRLLLTNLPIPNTKYQALELSVKKVMADGRLQFVGSWTHSFKNEGLADYSSKGAGGAQTGGYDACPYPEWCVDGRYGRLDSPDLVKFNGSYSHPWGAAGTTTLGLSDYYYSGAVYGAYTVRTSAQITDYLTEPGDKNVGSWNRLDMHLEHQFQIPQWAGMGISAYGDIFNVLNRQSALNRSGYLGYEVPYDQNPIPVYNLRYGYPSKWQNPRVYQFGVKLEF